eukprot:COSAG02_NODE_3577_length_6537_cov_17.172414_4_plen_86_part_00
MVGRVAVVVVGGGSNEPRSAAGVAVEADLLRGSGGRGVADVVAVARGDTGQAGADRRHGSRTRTEAPLVVVAQAHAPVPSCHCVS